MPNSVGGAGTSSTPLNKVAMVTGPPALAKVAHNTAEKPPGAGPLPKTDQFTTRDPLGLNKPTAQDAKATNTGNASPGGPTPPKLQEIEAKYGAIVDKAIAEHPNAKLDRNYIFATIMAESSGDPTKVGDNGTSFGLLQLNDTFNDQISREDRLNPEKAIPFAVNLMAGYSEKYGGDIIKLAAAYMTGDQLDGPFAEQALKYGQDILDMMQGK